MEERLLVQLFLISHGRRACISQDPEKACPTKTFQLPCEGRRAVPGSLGAWGRAEGAGTQKELPHVASFSHKLPSQPLTSNESNKQQLRNFVCNKNICWSP